MVQNTPTLSASAFGFVIKPGQVLLVFAISCGLVPSIATAQGQQFGLTVQLPTVRNFSVQTAVSVPDGGAVSLGGISRSAEGRVSRGIPGLSGRPFRNDAIGRSTNTGRATVTPRIIIQRELEEDLMVGARENQLTSQAKDYLDGKIAKNPLGGKQIAANAGKRGETQPIAVSKEGQIEAFANFLAANIGRRQAR